MISPWVTLLRPSHWVKNLLVFAALIFAGRLFDPGSIVESLVAFVAFCLIASASYVLNDVCDAERDRCHPEKRYRPIPANQVTRGAALLLAAVCAVGSGLIAISLGQGFVTILVSYGGLQIIYSSLLKHIVIIDAMAIATGFVLRAVGGGFAIGVDISPWLIICTFLLALFLAFAKRRHEVVILEEAAGAHRETLREYSPYFLDQMIAVVTAATVVSYAIYTASPEVREKLGTELLYLTIPFVLYGIFRYQYLVHQHQGGGDPTQVFLTDRPLLVNIVLWIGTAIWLLY